MRRGLWIVSRWSCVAQTSFVLLVKDNQAACRTRLQIHRYIHLTDFLKTNLKKFAFILVKGAKRQVS